MRAIDLGDLPWTPVGVALKAKSLWDGLYLIAADRDGYLNISAKGGHRLLVLKGKGRFIVNRALVPILSGIVLDLGDARSVRIEPEAGDTVMLLYHHRSLDSHSRSESRSDPFVLLRDDEGGAPADATGDAAEAPPAIAPAGRDSSSAPPADAPAAPPATAQPDDTPDHAGAPLDAASGAGPSVVGHDRPSATGEPASTRPVEPAPVIPPPRTAPPAAPPRVSRPSLPASETVSATPPKPRASIQSVPLRWTFPAPRVGPSTTPAAADASPDGGGAGEGS